MGKKDEKEEAPKEPTAEEIAAANAPGPAEAAYERYRARKQVGCALPLPAFHQLDSLERDAWEEAGKS